MGLWWILNITLLVAIIPVVIILLQRVIAAAMAVRRTLEDISDRSVAIVGELGAVDVLPETEYLVRETTAGLTRYGAALDEIL